MDETLILLLFKIRAVLMGASCFLLVCGVVGLCVRSYFSRADWVDPFARGDGDPPVKNGVMTEKRRARRLASKALMEIMDESGSTVAGSARVHDLSLKGARIQSQLILERGSRIQAKLHSTKEGVVPFSARVVWTSPRVRSILYGIEFETIGTAPQS